MQGVESPAVNLVSLAGWWWDGQTTDLCSIWKIEDRGGAAQWLPPTINSWRLGSCRSCESVGSRPRKKAEAAPCGTASLLLQHMVDELMRVSARSCRWSSAVFGRPRPWGPFEGRLAALSDEVIHGLLNPVPAEWRRVTTFAVRLPNCRQIAEYLREARKERKAFLNFVKHLLR